MSALTLKQISSVLGSYVEPNGDFKASLNQVLARISNTGTYKDLTVQYSLPVQDGCITLPDEADSVLHTMVDGFPLPVRSLWHDFKSIGTSQPAADMAWGLIDAGFHATKILLPEGTDTLYAKSSAEEPNGGGGFNPAEGGFIEVIATDGDYKYKSQIGTPDINGTPLEFDGNTITHIESIRFDGLIDKCDIVYIDATPTTHVLATVGPDSGVTRYRRFRLNRSTDNETVVHVLCKRSFQPLVDDNDICYIGNIGAIKQGLLGRISEDSGDVERAEYHWQRCTLLLEEEAASMRGAALPRLNVDPFGTGDRNRLVQML